MAKVLGVQYGVTSSEEFDTEKFRVDSSHDAIYIVQMDSDTANQDEVAEVSGVPFIGMPSPWLSGAYCVSREISEQTSKIWHVAATFKNNLENQPENDPPNFITPSWSWGFEVVEEPLLEDAIEDDKPIENSAGERFPTVTAPVAVPVLTIKRNEFDFSGERILTYLNHVNSDEFWGADPYQAFMAGVTASQTTVNEQKMWEVQYIIKFKMDEYGWRLRLLDHGHYSKGAPDIDGVYAKQPFGDTAQQQLLGNLDGEGGPNLGDKPVFLQFNKYEKIDFNDLNLGPW